MVNHCKAGALPAVAGTMATETAALQFILRIQVGRQ